MYYIVYGSKGLRHGDPLSLFLFIIVVVVLCILMLKVEQCGISLRDS